MMRYPRMRCTLTEHTNVFPEALVSLLAFPPFLSLSLFHTPVSSSLSSSRISMYFQSVASPFHNGVVALLCVCASEWDVRIWAWSLLLRLYDWSCLVLSRHMSLGHPQAHTHKFQSSILPPTLLSHMYSNHFSLSECSLSVKWALNLWIVHTNTLWQHWQGEL